MKTNVKMMIASIVVIALALTAVSSVTYSWFSDTENANISVSTANIDIIGEYEKYDGSHDANIIKTSNEDYDGDLVTNASISTDKKDLEIIDMLADRTITAKYKVTNNSTVDVLYRMYVSVDGITDGLATDSIKISAGTGTGNTMPVAMTTFTNGISYVVGTANSGYELKSSASSNTYVFTVTIIFDKTVSSAEDFSVRIVNEAYQKGYTYTDAQAIVNGQSSMPTTSVNKNVTFKGVAVGENDTVDDSEIEVIFSSEAANVATNNGSNAVILKTTMLEPESAVAKIDLSLDGATQTDFGENNWVTVTVVIPGEYTDLKVYYDGAEAQPEVLSISAAGGNTKVTFRTNHFSEFEILDDYIIIKDEAGLKEALTKDTSVIYVSNTITINDISTMDLKGTRIVAASPNVRTIFNIECDMTISNGKIINGSSTVEGSRVLNIDGTDKGLSGLSITLNDVDIIGPLQKVGATYTRGISFYKVSDASLTISGGSVSANYYAINIASDCPNFTLNVSNSNVSAGWCAYQTWSENTKATFTDCILQGTNDKSYNAEGWNDFATIVYNEKLPSTELNLNNCTIKSIVVPNESGYTNKQYYMSIRSPGAVINVDDCTFCYINGTTTESYSKLWETEDALSKVLGNVSIYGKALTDGGPTVKIDGQPITITIA